MWTRQWRRPPTDEELAGLVADQLKEEVLAREARSLELDVGDTVVRRRLAQKMAFMLDDTVRVTEPTERRTARPLRRASRACPHEARACPSRRSSSAASRGMAAPAPPSRPSPRILDLALLAEEQGDRLLLGDTFADQDEQALTDLFGAPFAQAVLALPAGRWSGPIKSGYGLHLVKVTADVAAAGAALCGGPGTPGGGMAPRAAGDGPDAAHSQSLMRKYQARGRRCRAPLARILRQPCGGPAMRLARDPRRADGVARAASRARPRGPACVSRHERGPARRVQRAVEDADARRDAPGARSGLLRPGRGPDPGRDPGDGQRRRADLARAGGESARADAAHRRPGDDPHGRARPRRLRRRQHMGPAPHAAAARVPHSHPAERLGGGRHLSRRSGSSTS